MTILAASSAQAQSGSVKDVFERYNLLGTFAWDCTKAASRSNFYYVHRLLDADHVQRDTMDGPDNRNAVTVIDKASESKPNEIAVSGTFNGKPYTANWRLEPKRIAIWESTVSGKKTIVEQRRPASGKQWPWATTCSAPR